MFVPSLFFCYICYFHRKIVSKLKFISHGTCYIITGTPGEEAEASKDPKRHEGKNICAQATVRREEPFAPIRKDVSIMKKIFALVLTVCLLLPLVACGQKGEGKKDDAEETKPISGIVNKLDSYLVLLDSNGDYHIFDYGEDVDQSTLEEGDKITVTYTGTLSEVDGLDGTVVSVEAAE